ncbi:MAG: PilN domain-containing protein [bacterium]
MTTEAAPQLVGLDIGDDALRLAAVADGVATCYSEPLPEGAVAGGEVQDPAAVGETLRAALAAADVRPRNAALALTGGPTVCRVEPLKSDSLPDAEATCADRMRRYLLFAARPTVVGHLLQDCRDALDHPPWLLSAAAPRQMVERQARAAKRAGLTVVRAEPALAVVARALLAADRLEPAFLLVAHGSGCHIGVLRPDGLVYCEHLDRSAEALARDPDLLAATLEQITDYHLRHAGGQEPLDTLWCCGAAAGLEPLVGCAADQGVGARWLDPADFPAIEGLHGAADSPGARDALAPAVAAALRVAEEAGHPRCLDLLPPPPRKRRAALLAPWIVVPAVVTLALTCGLVAWHHVVSRRAARLTHLLTHPTPEMVACSRLQLRESQLKQRRSEAEALLARAERRAGVAFLAELPRRMADEIWLERVLVKGEGTCAVDGMAHSEDGVFAFADALRRSPYVKNVRMGGTHHERRGDLILTRFRMDVTLGPRPETPAEGKGEE